MELTPTTSRVCVCVFTESLRARKWSNVQRGEKTGACEMGVRSVLTGLALATVLSVAAGASGSSRILQQLGESVNLAEIPPLTCASPGPFPYMVSVRDRKGDHLCGGVLIREDAVLTAAHCVDVRVSTNSNPRPIVYLGGFNRDDPVEERKTIETAVPDGWTGDVLDGSDLAILKLDKPSCLAPVPFLGARFKPEQQVNFLGFGRTSVGGSFSFILQSGRFQYLTNKECTSTFELGVPLDNRSVCIKGPNSAGICVGDDGGPAIIRPTNGAFLDRLVGIASYTTGDCTDADSVPIFTRVKTFIPWIKEQLEES